MALTSLKYLSLDLTNQVVHLPQKLSRRDPSAKRSRCIARLHPLVDMHLLSADGTHDVPERVIREKVLSW